MSAAPRTTVAVHQETAREHIANAVQMLDALTQGEVPQGFGITLLRIKSRLRTALRLCDREVQRVEAFDFMQALARVPDQQVRLRNVVTMATRSTLSLLDACGVEQRHGPAVQGTVAHDPLATGAVDVESGQAGEGTGE